MKPISSGFSMSKDFDLDVCQVKYFKMYFALDETNHVVLSPKGEYKLDSEDEILTYFAYH